MIEHKNALRQEALLHRSRMFYDIEDTADACDFFFNAIKPAKDQIVAAYWPKDREFDTLPILERLILEGVTCCLPVVEKGSHILKFARWDKNSAMKRDKFGVFIPDNQDFLEPDILIVPMLAFDRAGYRLGYGGGYFDATLAYLRGKKKIMAVGLAYAQQACLFNLPREDHDAKMDWVITPKGTHYFGV